MRSLNALALSFSFAASLVYAQEPADAPPSPVKDPVPSQESRLKLENYLIPAAEILVYETALNLFDRLAFTETDDFDSSWDSFTYNIRHGWVFDDDSYQMNQFLHPYGGSIYFGLARSAGLSFYESFAYAFIGSAIWEYAGETTSPSINDQITTSLAGTFLGEALFRMANLLLEDADGKPDALRELAAAAICPPLGLNRNAFGHKFDRIYPSRAPSVYVRFAIGGLWNAHVSDHGVPSHFHAGAVVADFSIAYGQPGKPGYTYSRPFDYFKLDVEVSSVPGALLQSLLLHGLILGTAFHSGSDFRGIWGLYGMYDYICPELFRASNTGFALGTTGQWWMSKKVALQTTLLAGLGFGAGGTIVSEGERDYHYGIAPEIVVGGRLLLSDIARIELTVREYMITGYGSDDRHGVENVLRAQLGGAVRIWGRHALALQYTIARRDAYYSGPSDRHQMVGSVSLMYTLLGDTNFGAVEWR